MAGVQASGDSTRSLEVDGVGPFGVSRTAARKPGCRTPASTCPRGGAITSGISAGKDQLSEAPPMQEAK